MTLSGNRVIKDVISSNEVIHSGMGWACNPLCPEALQKGDI
jgi:hypothetical protein